MVKKVLLSVFLLISSFVCFADTIDDFINSQNEQTLMANWIKENTKRQLSDDFVTSIVKEVYARSISLEISPRLVVAVMKLESDFNPKARSYENARGLMQVIARFHKEKLKGRNPYEPRTSIEVGTKILYDCFQLKSGDFLKSLSCYSGGGGHKYANKVNTYLTSIEAYVKIDSVQVVLNTPTFIISQRNENE